MNTFWSATLKETIENSGKLSASTIKTNDITAWLLAYSENSPTSSNQGAANLPFQRWFHFKEAFSPKFVTDTLSALPYQVNKCLDPFSGSGTTAITCRMLGINSEGVEVNPFLADLIEAKLTTITTSEFCINYEKIISKLELQDADYELSPGMPLTLIEPGVKEKYVFNREIFSCVRAITRSSKSLPAEQARLLRVLVGSVLVENSNVVINGKGRRYRRNWQTRNRTYQDFIDSLDRAVDIASQDLTKFSSIPSSTHIIHRGDAREALSNVKSADVAIFSPPYPNSFDYTDVYNLELWMLGYLTSPEDNKNLRNSTLRSHVQTKWTSSTNTLESSLLRETLSELTKRRAELWNINIPEMVNLYFEDLWSIFHQLKRILKPGHHAVVAIGDSQYAGVHIDVGAILTQTIKNLGFRVVEHGAIRSMRNSSQHGGNFELAEHCLVFERS